MKTIFKYIFNFFCLILCTNLFCQTKSIILSNGDSKNAKLITIDKIVFNQCYIKDNEGTYGMAGSVEVIKSNDKKDIKTATLILGNGGGNNGKQNSYGITLSFQKNLIGINNITGEENGEIIYTPKRTHLYLEYALKNAQVKITKNDGTFLSGEISGVFKLLSNPKEKVAPEIQINKLLFTNLKINKS